MGLKYHSEQRQGFNNIIERAARDGFIISFREEVGLYYHSKQIWVYIIQSRGGSIISSKAEVGSKYHSDQRWVYNIIQSRGGFIVSFIEQRWVYNIIQSRGAGL